jgi:hypothetical protein
LNKDLITMNQLSTLRELGKIIGIITIFSCSLIVKSQTTEAPTQTQVESTLKSCTGVKVPNNSHSTVTHEHKIHFNNKDSVPGIVSHRWYSHHSPQNTPEQMFTDEGTRQYYLTTYGFDIFEVFPDFPRWTVKNPDPNQVREYKLRVAEWTDKNPKYTEFMEKRMQELKNN